MYDIVYSITVHEAVDCYYDMIRNLFYFNKGIRIFVIVHCNPFMYSALKSKPIQHVALNPNATNKTYFTYDLPEAHIDNYMYCFNNGIQCKYYITYASNCMFHKQLELSFIERLFIEEPEYEAQKYHTAERMSRWPSVNFFLRNTYLINRLKELGMGEIYPYQHEGVVFESYIYKELADFLITNNIKSMIKYPYACFEELLIPTVYVNIKKQGPVNICRLFWCLTPTIEEIKLLVEPAVKTIERKYDNEVRVWLREITNSYEGTELFEFEFHA